MGSTAENIALHLENVTMQFGGVVSVNNLTLDVPEHKIIALIGPNGAGKTTAFNCITGVYQPTNGLIEFMGKPIVRNHPAGKAAKSYLGENADKYAKERCFGPYAHPGSDNQTGDSPYLPEYPSLEKHDGF